MYEIKINSLEETKALAKKMGEHIHKKTIILLTGDLGAGKTTFTQNLAIGLGVKEIVNSPTFTILKQYESGRLPLYHIDAYRLEGSEEDLGFSEYMEEEAVVVIEWPQFIEEDIPDTYIRIHITYEEETKRLLKVESQGQNYCEFLEEVLK